MKIQSIQLKHTLHFTDITLNFNYHDLPITLILGDQSSGKTSLLRFSYQALTWFAARYKDLRTAGVVMLDQDIMLNRLQSKLDIQVSFPEDIGAFQLSSDQQDQDPQCCSWQLYKTLNSQGVGLSKAETQQLESMVALYQKALKADPLQGLPLIAYYPAERFVNDVNILNKNNPAIFQPSHAYEISAIPFTTFIRFFEWFREISDIENAQSAELIQNLLHPKNPTDASNTSDTPLFGQKLAQAQADLHAPSLRSLKQALETVLPDVTNIYLQYHPKLQLMVCYQGKDMLFQQLSNSVRNLVALIGDIVRRLCLLNPHSLYPCQEGDGILLIDAIDHQLDQNMTQVILTRLNQAFPRLQIIASGNRPELLEQASRFQCLQLQNKKLSEIQPEKLQETYDQIYQQLQLGSKVSLPAKTEETELNEPLNSPDTIQHMLQLIQTQLTEQQQQELVRALSQRGDQDVTIQPLS
ncbi:MULTISPECIES: AAA family ATPase [unclassified Acinetobacter]|uniref:ATP-binding protein n=1 Tax=unclassified Acinetobacter TaxID=196816 RepID=UPI0015D39EC6|nr:MULTISPECIES: AAA family ATPase [unclassified Acinetobacter]UUS61064.1 AAA family ATPase [Acinetobacter sp. YH16056_T]